MIWKIQNRTFSFEKQGWIMGILNVTPDSFSDGGSYTETTSALAHARVMIHDGADVIDIGGESTRPGALPVSEEEEKNRVLPIITTIRKESDILISIDTSKPSVAAAAIEAGANIINDVSGFRNVEMMKLIAKSGVGAICMHMAGTPSDMQTAPVYVDVIQEVRSYFVERLNTCRAYGISLEKLIFDPGIGFGKTVAHNLALLRNLPLLRVGDRPIMIGVSRKSFIGKIIENNDAVARFWPTVALTAWCREAGVEVLRVHDVLANVQSMKMVEAIRG